MKLAKSTGFKTQHFISSIRSNHQTLKRRSRSSSFFSAGKRPSPHPRAFSGDDEGTQPSSCVRRPTAARSISRPDSTEFLLPVLGECFCVSSPMQPSSFRRDLRTNCIPSRTVCCCEEEEAASSPLRCSLSGDLCSCRRFAQLSGDCSLVSSPLLVAARTHSRTSTPFGSSFLPVF